jgi:hypothetical protein
MEALYNISMDGDYVSVMQGVWMAPMIENPDFKDDPHLYKLPPIKYLGFELWQVKSGSIFDNVVISDSIDEALALAKETWGASVEKEKAMHEAILVRSSFLIIAAGIIAVLAFACCDSVI